MWPFPTHAVFGEMHSWSMSQNVYLRCACREGHRPRGARVHTWVSSGGSRNPHSTQCHGVRYGSSRKLARRRRNPIPDSLEVHLLRLGDAAQVGRQGVPGPRIGGRLLFAATHCARRRFKSGRRRPHGPRVRRRAARRWLGPAGRAGRANQHDGDLGLVGVEVEEQDPALCGRSFRSPAQALMRWEVPWPRRPGRKAWRVSTSAVPGRYRAVRVAPRREAVRLLMVRCPRLRVHAGVSVRQLKLHLMSAVLPCLPPGAAHESSLPTASVKRVGTGAREGVEPPPCTHARAPRTRCARAYNYSGPRRAAFLEILAPPHR